MLKIDFRKDLPKVLIGFFALFGICNGYFAISGNLPKHSGEGFTVQIAGIAAVFGLLISLFILCRMYLKKGGEKITCRDFAKMLFGALFLGVGASLKNFMFLETGICFVLFCIFFYLGFVKK